VRVKSYSGAHGFGYLEQPQGDDVIFDVTACERFTPRIGDEVEADIRTGRDGRLRAVAVRLRARSVPAPGTVREGAVQLERQLDPYRAFGFFRDLTWRDLYEYFLRRREGLPGRMTSDDVVTLLVDRCVRGVETSRLVVHPQEFHLPKAAQQLERLLEDTPVAIELVRQHGSRMIVYAPALGPDAQTFELAGVPELVAVYNRALQDQGCPDRLFRLESPDQFVYVRLSPEQALEIRRRDLLPLRWAEVEQFL